MQFIYVLLKRTSLCHFFPFIEKASNEHWTSLYCATKDIDQVMEGAKRPVPKRAFRLPFTPPQSNLCLSWASPHQPRTRSDMGRLFRFLWRSYCWRARDKPNSGDEPEYHSDGTYTMGVPMDNEGKCTFYSSTPSAQKLLEAKRRKIAADHSDSELSTTVGDT